MILHLCDYCGRETSPGKNISQRLSTVHNLNRRWKREDYTPRRSSRINLEIGIDDITDTRQMLGHDLCRECQLVILRALIESIEGAQR